MPGQRRGGEELLGQHGRASRRTTRSSSCIRDRADYEYAKDVVARYSLPGRCAAVLFSPVHGVLARDDLAAWILADRLPVRLQLQAHKYIWGASPGVEGRPMNG